MSFRRTGILFAGVAACLLTACETTPVAPPPAPEPPPPEPVVEASAPVVTPPPPPAKPAKKPKKTAKKPQEAPKADTTAIESTNLDAVALAPKAAEPAIKGPAWLSRCAAKRMEGGVILCDVDTLIAQPSANVRIFTRDKALAGSVADGGAISYREGLPRRYRLFVVP